MCSPHPPAGASRRAAAAAAAWHILYNVFADDNQRNIIQDRYEKQLAQMPNGQEKDDGIAFGQSVSQEIIALRSSDGHMAVMNVPHPDGTLPGEWQRTGSGEPMAPGWGQVTPWAMLSGDQFDQGGPPPLDSPEYSAAYNEVVEWGGKESPYRSERQEHIAMFWDPHVPAKWNWLARDISLREQLTLSESARLFGLLSVTLADTAISVWNMKYKYNFWRPMTAIQLGDGDNNDQTSGNPMWESFLVAPAFPEYVSGHSHTCAAVAMVLGRYLGTDVYTFQLRSSHDMHANDPPRSYTSFMQAAEEAGLSRIHGGIHFRFAHEDGMQAGIDLAHYVFDNFFTPR